MTTRKKKPDAFAAFDQEKHNLALREIYLCRSLLTVYRYAMENKVDRRPGDRKQCEEVKRIAESELYALDDECGACERCCEHGQQRVELRDVIAACEHVLDELEPRP